MVNTWHEGDVARSVQQIVSQNSTNLYVAFCIRCYGVTSWQPCLKLRGYTGRTARSNHTAAASDHATVTVDERQLKSEQQKKQPGQKGGKNAGGKADKKSELAVTPKSEDFARYLKRLHHSCALHICCYQEESYMHVGTDLDANIYWCE